MDRPARPVSGPLVPHEVGWLRGAPGWDAGRLLFIATMTMSLSTHRSSGSAMTVLGFVTVRSQADAAILLRPWASCAS